MNKGKTRRSFLKKATLGSAAITSAPYIFASSYQQKFMLSRDYRDEIFSSNDQVNIGLIGSGIQGIYDTTA
ncbi:MAG: twin-arginine translocation signal domain-containing protein, partial [Eudoraea sp.]|nr:twin-arginine translocation signal domain-containing protein [Eudoraea sp.]